MSDDTIKMPVDVSCILHLLPHRYPFLLVDKVVALEPGVRCVAVKGVSVNEPFFQGHFPGRPIMPGVLQVEALAQVGGIVMKDLIAGEDGEARDFFFGGVDKVRWRKPVVPGDVLFMETVMVSYKARFGIAKMRGVAYVDGKVACEAELTLVVDVRGRAK
jgi:3-hydroxyacyl-[acyl-carrier-protein] dehydratase